MDLDLHKSRNLKLYDRICFSFHIVNMQQRRPRARHRRRVSRPSTARTRSTNDGSYRHSRSWPGRTHSAANTTNHGPATLQGPNTPQSRPQNDDWDQDPVRGVQSSHTHHHHTPQKSPLLQEKGSFEIKHRPCFFCQGKKWCTEYSEDPV